LIGNNDKLGKKLPAFTVDMIEKGDAPDLDESLILPHAATLTTR
jgi:hypothetical protein